MNQPELPSEVLAAVDALDWIALGAAIHMHGDACFRAGMERAAQIAANKAESIRRVNTYRGKVNGPSGFAADMVDAAAAAIRAETPVKAE